MEAVDRQEIDEKRPDEKNWNYIIYHRKDGKAVSMEVLGKICMALGCNIGDIVDVVDEN